MDVLIAVLQPCSAFSPLPGFMDEATYDHVVEHSRLPVRCLWEIACWTPAGLWIASRTSAHACASPRRRPTGIDTSIAVVYTLPGRA